MKRVLSLLLGFVIFVLTVLTSSLLVKADDNPTFCVSSRTANPGQKVSLTIKLNNNPGIASIKLKITFDDALSLDKIDYNTALGGKSQQPEKFTSPVILNWFNGSEDVFGDLVFATLQFTVQKNATIGSHDVNVTYNQDDVYNIREDDVVFDITNGKINVTNSNNVNFPDVSYTAWYGDAVAYAVGAGLMKGYGSGKFGTADGIQRQDFVVILSRLSGDDLSKYEGKTSFKDVAKGAYYAAALAWAKDKGVSSGYANGKFGVGDKVTREQIMVFLYNYAKLKGYDTTATLTEAQAKATYADFGKVSGYAKEAALWALSKGVVSGKDAGGGKKLIAPNLNALRCEVAGMFYNIEQKNIFAEE